MEPLKNEIDLYIESFPEQSQKLMQQLRRLIHKSAPGAIEVMSYKMPAFKLNEILVYFGAHNNHIGFYPTSSPIKKFKVELTFYNTSKGAIQFPLDKPLPATLIEKIVKYRVEQSTVHNAKM